MRTRCLFVLLTLALSTTAVAAPYPAQFQEPTADSHLGMSGLHRAIYAYQYLDVRVLPNSVPVRAYLNFPLDPTPAGAEISRARLILYRQSAAEFIPDCFAAETSGWDVDNLLGDTAPDLGIPASYVGNEGGYDAWDVTLAVQAAEPTSSATFILKKPDETTDSNDTYRVRSMEYPGTDPFRPLLVVEYDDLSVKGANNSSWGAVKALY